MMMMMMSMEQLVDSIMCEETKVCGRNLPQYRFVDYKSHTI
jgi:hypothetical protein